MSDPTERSPEDRLRMGRTDDEVEGHHYRSGPSSTPDLAAESESTPGLDDDNADVDAHTFRHGASVEEPRDVDAHAYRHGASVEQPQDVQAHSPADGDERVNDETEDRARLIDAEDDVEGHSRR